MVGALGGAALPLVGVLVATQRLGGVELLVAVGAGEVAHRLRRRRPLQGQVQVDVALALAGIHGGSKV